ncbi:protocadherin beta-16-like [Brachyhypopomus gauderio]|uniref:protocadherin beta-16-like n=1 Tax=Brachyhypopomus gauderio TaxID=698409 RepID=UPI0040414129
MEANLKAQYRLRYVSMFFLLSVVFKPALAVIHYSIPEEMEEGSVVANLAADLSLDLKTLRERKMRLDVASNRKYLDVKKDTGEMYIVERIDREYLCLSKSATTCVLKLDATIENPVRLFNIELEIMDINDNAPQFRRDTMHLDISEATTVGERFSLTNAVDPDIGSNSVKTYYLSESDHFSIEIQTGRDGSKFADLILKKTLDREEQDIHSLILTAVDGGVPARSGTASIIVRVLDTNDNAPQFDKDSYTINLIENTPIGSLVVKLNASDEDDGTNSEIIYSFSLYTSEKTQNTFSLNQENGEIRVKEMVNFEDFKIYNMEIIATDQGKNSLSGQCKLTILITDMNDNHPEISIKSFTNPIKEDIAVGTVIAVVSVTDKDSGENGQMDVYISDGLPFLLRESSDNYYELVITAPLDREKIPEYDITFTVKDRGNPPLFDNETVTLELLDVNDNVPQFPQTFYTIPVMENNAPGALLYSLTAIDPDLHENQYLVYFIIEKEIVNTSMSILFSINPENGNLYALKTFDYEIEKEFLFHIEARDSGVPPLSSNVTVHIIIMDQNDNTPVIVSPWRAHGSVVEEKIPRSTDKGTLIAKVIAIDTDSVHNSRITYQFLQNTDATLFSLDQYNGEIRTMRMFSYRDSRHQRLVVIAKDNGDPSLSATVTIKLSTVETALKTYADMTEVPLEYDIFSDLNLYLVIGLGSVSFLLLITILVTIVLKCQKPKPSKAAPPCRNSVISERNSTIADSTLVSNDAYWYSLFLAETRKGKLVVRQPVPKGSRYIVSSIPRSTGLTETSDSAASTLQVGDIETFHVQVFTFTDVHKVFECTVLLICYFLITFLFIYDSSAV